MGNPSEKDVLLSYLDELLSFEASKLVGKIMKRFEIISERDVLRKSIKELVYESSRELKDIFNAYGRGIDTTQFHFIKKEGKK